MSQSTSTSASGPVTFTAPPDNGGNKTLLALIIAAAIVALVWLQKRK